MVFDSAINPHFITHKLVKLNFDLCNFMSYGKRDYNVFLIVPLLLRSSILYTQQEAITNFEENNYSKFSI
jgi:hypothetical protein